MTCTQPTCILYNSIRYTTTVQLIPFRQQCQMIRNSVRFIHIDSVVHLLLVESNIYERIHICIILSGFLEPRLSLIFIEQFFFLHIAYQCALLFVFIVIISANLLWWSHLVLHGEKNWFRRPFELVPNSFSI